MSPMKLAPRLITALCLIILATALLYLSPPNAQACVPGLENVGDCTSTPGAPTLPDAPGNPPGGVDPSAGKPGAPTTGGITEIGGTSTLPSTGCAYEGSSLTCQCNGNLVGPNDPCLSAGDNNNNNNNNNNGNPTDANPDGTPAAGGGGGGGGGGGKPTPTKPPAPTPVPPSDGPTVKGESLPLENKDPKACPSAQKTTIFTCEGYPAINPNVAMGKNIGSLDGITTDCGTGGAKEFISSKDAGYTSYEFAQRYDWFRWGINIGADAVPSSVITPASVAKAPPIESDLKTPAPNARKGLGNAASASGLCKTSLGTLNDTLNLAGAIAYTPQDIADNRQPVPGDLIVFNNGHVGIIVGTATAKGSSKIIDVTWANEGDVPNPPKGGYANLPPTDSSICRYVHAFANASTVDNSCTPGGKGQGTGDPSKNGTGNSAPPASGSSVTGTFSSDSGNPLSATGVTTTTTNGTSTSNTVTDTGNIKGTVTNGKLSMSGTVTGALSGTITAANGPANAITGSMTANFMATFANNALSDLQFPAPTNPVFNANGTDSGQLEFGQLQNPTITDPSTGAFTATISGLTANKGKVTGNISGTITVKSSGQSSTPPAKQVKYKFTATENEQPNPNLIMTGTMTGTWDSNGQFSGNFTASGLDALSDVTVTISGTVTKGVIKGTETAPSDVPSNVSGKLDNGDDTTSPVNGTYQDTIPGAASGPFSGTISATLEQ